MARECRALSKVRRCGNDDERFDWAGSRNVGRPSAAVQVRLRAAESGTRGRCGITLLAAWERTRGTVPLTRLMDAHYSWSIRYHFFLGYNRYSRDEKRFRQDLVSPIQPALAKEYQMKAKGEL